MPRDNLTDVRIGALVPRKTSYEIRDGKLRGFGVRVTPSGRKRFFVHCQNRGERVWRIVGEFEEIGVIEARSRATAPLAAIRRGKSAPARPEEAFFEPAAETVFRQYERVWKPRTLRVNRGYLERQILPWFGGRPIAETDGREVRNWFASLAATPAAADRSMPILSVIMRGAETIRLLLLTGCRKSELLPLRWSDYRKGRLFLRDSNVGPRTVWLSQPARIILDSIERTGARVFPSPRAARPRCTAWLDDFWWRIREEAGLNDVRLHDLRHTQASHAAMNGVPIPVISRLLGHSSVRMTLRYAHLGDREIEQAAERVRHVPGRFGSNCRS